ncbi:MAG: DUF6695 family protein [Flavobacteriaceae bacterium]|nr:DUF6695 family protein [Flavobacteriaceae bacterium]
MKSDALIISLAYPDTFVCVSQEFICKVLPIIGVGTKEYLKAGHAALVLIRKEDGEAFYFDFGRYITPLGCGRVRSSRTDAELVIPIKAAFDENENLSNLEDFLLFLESNPEKTHGKGKLIASVSNDIHFESAWRYIHELQALGSIPYGGFIRNGSNCSRFVTDSLYHATTREPVKKGLEKIKRFTPSPLGNVAYGCTDGNMFEVENGIIRAYNRNTTLHNLENFFDRNNPDWNPLKVERKAPYPDAQYLDGIGSGAWFLLTAFDASQNLYRIRRFNDAGVLDFDGVFSVDKPDFTADKSFTFIYDSHCLYCHVAQEGNTYRFDFIRQTALENAISLTQKARSA